MSTTTVRIPYPRRRWPVVAVGILVVAASCSSSFLSNFYVDILWYREVDLSQVFWTRIWAQAGLASAFFVTFFVLLLVNLYRDPPAGPDDRGPDARAGDRRALPGERRAVPPVGDPARRRGPVALRRPRRRRRTGRSSCCGGPPAGSSFGNPEPVFGRDPAFYVFTLPWLKYLQGWLFASLVGVTVIVGIGHFLQGGIRPQAVGLRDKVDPQVRAHLSVLLGLILLAKAWGYYLGRFDLLTSDRGVVQGASYTDVKAQLPALTFLAIVAVICARAVLRERPVPGLEPADHRGRPPAARVDPAGHGVPGVHPAVPRQAERAAVRACRTSSGTSRGPGGPSGSIEIRLEERPTFQPS